MNYTPPIQYLMRQSFRRFITCSLLTTGLIILVRLYEIFFISHETGYPSGSIPGLIYGIRFDLLLSFRLSGYLLIPFLFIDHFSQRVARIFYAAVSVVVVITEISLLRYFSATQVPLGSEILGYSISEIIQIVRASGEINIAAILPVVLFFAFTVYIFYKWYNLRISRSLVVLFSFFMFSSLLPVYNFNPVPAEYKNKLAMNIAANKLIFFSGSVFNYYFPGTESPDLKNKRPTAKQS